MPETDTNDAALFRTISERRLSVRYDPRRAVWAVTARTVDMAVTVTKTADDLSDAIHCAVARIAEWETPK